MCEVLVLDIVIIGVLIAWVFMVKADLKSTEEYYLNSLTVKNSQINELLTTTGYWYL